MTLRFWTRTGWKLAAVSLVAAAAFAAALIYRGHRTPECASVNALNDALVQILSRSLTGLPANPYYKAHPERLHDALVQVNDAIVELEKARC